MQKENNHNSLFVIAGILIFVVSMFLVGHGTRVLTLDTLAHAPVVHTEIIYDINDPFSEEKVLIYLNELHVKYPNVALAQMKVESANGTSKVFREGNNLFGMQAAVKRPTTSLGIRNNHAYYSHWRQSVIDYALFQAFVSNPENMDSEAAWLSYIGHVYAEDNQYKQKLIVVLNSIRKEN